MDNRLRIALVGPSCVGKTTTRRLLQTALSPAASISVARPLHRIQSLVYELAGVVDPRIYGAQDSSLSRFARQALLDINPHALEDNFITAVSSLPADMTILNDDARLAMYPTLRNLGFVFVRVSGPLRDRKDATEPMETSRHDRVIPSNQCDYEIRNYGTLNELTREVGRFASVVVGGVK